MEDPGLHEVRQGTLGVDTRGWGPAGNTGRGWSWLRSVRQGTLGGDGRGWGPAGNTGRGYSRLRSGREHWAVMVVVEVRQGTLGVDGRGWGPAGSRRRGDEERRRGEEEEEEEQATDIKSNNPHLAGGEKYQKISETCWNFESFWINWIPVRPPGDLSDFLSARTAHSLEALKFW